MKSLALLTLSLALASCARPPQEPPAAATPAATATAPSASTAPAEAAQLAEYHWMLDQALDAQGKRIDALFARAGQPVRLDFSDSRISVGNTCNRMNGRYVLDGNTLQVARLTSTMMACADAKLMALDQEVGKRLQTSQALALRGGDAPTLTLTSAAGDALTFRGVPTAQTRYGVPGETAFLEVAARTQPCRHPLIPDMRCLQVRDVHFDEHGLKTGTPGPWRPLYEDIEGYQHVDGVRNVLRVKRYDIKNPPADASSVAYVLDMVVESGIDGPPR